MVEGRFTDGETSAVVGARLTLEGSKLIIRDDTGVVLYESSADNVSISSRLANLPRTLTLHHKRLSPVFETDDHEAIETLIPDPRNRRNWLYQLESNIKWVLAATVLTLGFSIWLVTYAIPAGAKSVALALPSNLLDRAGNQVLTILDRAYLAPSQLDSDEQLRIRALLAPHFSDPNQTLYFRSWVPNALALPDGGIVLTDELIQLVEDDKELVAIVHHELAHLSQRHLIRRSLQDSSLLIGLFLITGDLSGADFLSGVSVTIADLAYSRDFEREADRHALATLAKAGISKTHYRNILQKLDQWYRDQSTQSDDGFSPLRYLSTHPQTAERLAAIDAYPEDT